MGEIYSCQVEASKTHIELPTHTKVLVSYRATPGIKHFGTACAVAKPANNSWWYAEDGLVIASSLVAPDKAIHYTLVINLSHSDDDELMDV